MGGNLNACCLQCSARSILTLFATDWDVCGLMHLPGDLSGLHQLQLCVHAQHEAFATAALFPNGVSI